MPQNQAFTDFSKLPNELKGIIWTFAARESRVVEIEIYTQNLTHEGRGRMNKTEVRFRSHTLVPAILHASSTSRAMGLKHYERLCCEHQFTSAYINWSRDYIRFSDSLRDVLAEVAKANTRLSEIAQKCQRLIVPVREFDIWYRSQQFRELEEVVLLAGLEEPPPWRFVSRKSGNLTLVQPDDPRMSRYNREDKGDGSRALEGKFRILLKIDDLGAFGAALKRDRQPIVFPGRHCFYPWEVNKLIEPFGRVRRECKSVVLMSAIRGKEEGMNQEGRDRRERMKKIAVERQYRLDHFGFTDD